MKTFNKLTQQRKKYKRLQILRGVFAKKKWNFALTQKEVCAALDITEPYLSMILRGKRVPDKMIENAIHFIKSWKGTNGPSEG